MRNSGTAARLLSFRALILPTTLRWGTVPDMIAGTASSVSVSMPSSLEPFMIGSGNFANNRISLVSGN